MPELIGSKPNQIPLNCFLGKMAKADRASVDMLPFFILQASIPSGQSSYAVSDSRITSTSIVFATVAANDSAMKSVSVVAGSGSVTLYPNAAATGATLVNLMVFW